MRQTVQNNNEKVFMIIVEPLDVEGTDEDDWVGTVNKISTITRVAVANLETKLTKKMTK